MTARLYYDDSYLRQFRATVVEVAENKVYLDRTAFYPTSGGQPYDTGFIAGARVVDVADEDDRVAHLVASPVELGDVDCAIDWPRRFDHMQQHTGQHVLSAVLMERLGIPTVSFHLGQEASTIDVETATLDARQVKEVEEQVNQVICENRPLSVSYGDPAGDLGLRKPSERSGLLRVVCVEGLDRSACGGTHVRATGEIGPVLVRKLDKVRGNVRIEFLCGLRAVRQARADFQALSLAARSLSAPLDEVPSLVAAQLERLAELEKLHRKLAVELAQFRGAALHHSTAPNHRGLRLHLRRIPAGALDDELRAEAQAFAAAGSAAFLALVQAPPSVLLAVSADAPVQAGAVLKELLARHGGRGGGNPQVAQGSVPSKEALDLLASELTDSFS